MSLDHVRTGPAFDAGPSDRNGDDGDADEQAARPRPRRWRRRILVGATGVAVMAAVAAVVVLRADDNGGTGAATSADGTTTVPVEVRDLVISDTLSGALGFGDANPVDAGRDGVVTGVAAVGTTVGQGGVLFHLDLEPTVLLHGAIPAFREMSVGVHAGSDILQLEQALLALGYGNGVTVDGEFTSATASAVTAWETALGRSRPDGLVSLGDVVFAPTDLRVSQVTAETGTQVASGGEVVQATGTTKVVTLNLPFDDVANLEAGMPVAVNLPDAREATGTIAAVATEPSTAGSSSGSGSSGQGEGEGGDGGEGEGEGEDETYAVTVSLDDPAVAADFDSGSVEVTVERSRVEDATAVPVIALLAQSTGGYAVQVVDDDEPQGYRNVQVEVGAIAGDWVEVSGDGIEAGVEVVVPG